MPQLTRCPHCNQSLQVPDTAAGKPIRCPLCKQLFAVRVAPVAEPVAAAAVAAKPAAPSAKAPAPPSIPDGDPRATMRRAPAPPSNGPAAPAPSECPACKAKLLPGASACMDCGYLVQGEGAAIDSEASPNLCPNAACGVANSAGARVCQRCSSPLPMPAGTVLHGRYRIESLIAIGGFAAVYLATDTRNGNRAVAVKDMIGNEGNEFAIRLSFFKREAEILQSLSTLPAVPRVYDFVQKGNSAQLVLEYIRGQDLLKTLEANNNKPFDLERVIEWGKSICDVLNHMHTLTPPVVHRDVKPENIMLSEDQRTIKMIDFGTARGTGRSQKTRLASKTRVYTEGYAPPEQIIGKPEARSDLFALAGTLYHLATGKAPEGFYTARELESQLADPNGSLPAEHRWLFELIKLNLAEDVNDRYFSCREVKADLERRRITKEVSCPKCKASNPVRQPYCNQCAEPLTETMPACHDCGKSNRMGSRWCIHCGHRLR